MVYPPAAWRGGDPTELELRLEPTPNGSRVIFELRGEAGPVSDGAEDLAAWFGSGLLAPIVHALSPPATGDWLTDRRVRRPTGRSAREMYADPLFHWPNFRLILDRIALRADDRLLEVGCGGGAFLHKALESGCRATGVDHSPEMVRLTQDQNREAIAAGRLEVLQSEAYPLPVPGSTFTCAVMTGVIGFLPDPVAALSEIHRALRPGGRIAILGSTDALRGTPAAPEPFSSRLRFFTRKEFEEVGRQAGFAQVQVDQPDLESYARASGVPEEALSMFRPEGGALLLTAIKV